MLSTFLFQLPTRATWHPSLGVPQVSWVLLKPAPHQCLRHLSWLPGKRAQGPDYQCGTLNYVLCPVLSKLLSKKYKVLVTSTRSNWISNWITLVPRKSNYCVFLQEFKYVKKFGFLGGFTFQNSKDKCLFFFTLLKVPTIWSAFNS